MNSVCVVLLALAAILVSCKESSEKTKPNPEMVKITESYSISKTPCNEFKNAVAPLLNKKKLDKEERDLALKHLEKLPKPQQNRKPVLDLMKSMEQFNSADAGLFMAFISESDCDVIAVYGLLKKTFSDTVINSDKWWQLKKVLYNQLLSLDHSTALDFMLAQSIAEKFGLGKNKAAQNRIKSLKQEAKKFISSWSALGEKYDEGSMSPIDFNRFRLQIIEEFEVTQRFRDELVALIEWENH